MCCAGNVENSLAKAGEGVVRVRASKGKVPGGQRGQERACGGAVMRELGWSGWATAYWRGMRH
jgi:hypothetical protein